MEGAVLDPAVFTHEAHLRWGWLLLENNHQETAIAKACKQLLAYTSELGVPDKFNKTVTIAAMKAIDHFRKRYPASDFEDFITKAVRLKTSFKELMAAHYSRDIFADAVAKKVFQEPDLLPFD